MKITKVLHDTNTTSYSSLILPFLTLPIRTNKLFQLGNKILKCTFLKYFSFLSNFGIKYSSILKCLYLFNHNKLSIFIRMKVKN